MTTPHSARERGLTLVSFFFLQWILLAGLRTALVMWAWTASPFPLILIVLIPEVFISPFNHFPRTHQGLVAIIICSSGVYALMLTGLTAVYKTLRRG